MQNRKRELTSCELCGAPPAEQKRTWSDTAPGSGSYDYMTCSCCRLVFNNPPPDEADQAGLHRHQYAASASHTIPERLYKLDPERSIARLYSKSHQAWARKLLTRLCGILKSDTKRRVRFLKVGCASGGVVKAARDIGIEATGVEVSPDVARHGVEKEHLNIRTRGFKIVQWAGERKQMGWRRPLIRLAENVGHEIVKILNQGHFVLLIAGKGVP